MSFDNSRDTFKKRKNYSGVVMQQGRVQLDADWNEWLEELTRRLQAGTLDILGRAVYPITTPHAFEIATSTSSRGKNTVLIGPGRMYVDGLLVENHGTRAAAQWDPVLGEMSDTPLPPLSSATTGAIDYTQQPYMPAGTTLPSGNGPFLAYLDAWVRPVDYINDPHLIDPAVGVDSTGRLQTVWQVHLLPIDSGVKCNDNISGWPPAPSSGLLSTGTTPTPPSGPCCLTSGTAYTGLENQFYRVEIHKPGTPEGTVPPTKLADGTATFKWSRDNSSVTTGVTSIANVTNSAGKHATQLVVESMGRDQVLGFAPGNWIEIVNDSLEYSQKPRKLHQIDTIDFSAKTITLTKRLTHFSTGDTDAKEHTRIRRWDQSGKVYEQNGTDTTLWWDIDAQGTAEIPVPPTDTWLILENGITVSFELSSPTGGFNTGDFWNFAARTATGQVEKLDKAAPSGIHHHYAQLSIVTFPKSATDCRTEWPPSTGESECGCCCTYTVGDGANSFGKYISINDAINALPDFGGEVCILPGLYFENVVIQGRRDVVLRGCGWQTRIASASPKPPPPPADPAAVATHATAAAGGVNTDTPPFAAVITISQSQHVELLSFAVEAAEDEVGILIDGTGKLSAASQSNTSATNIAWAPIIKGGRTLDVTVEDLVITASKVPAILADTVTLLQIESNRIAMENVAGRWPAVWVSGNEIRIVQNWLGIRSKAADLEWLPATVQSDIAEAAQSDGTSPAPGGIQIAGTSTGVATTDVFVIENEIDSAGWNGITLGSVAILDANGNDTGEINGVMIEVPGPCDTTIAQTIPGSKSGQHGGKVVAAGNLVNIQISSNRIRNTGACGIGPVGFFDPSSGPEIVSIQNLSISANTIASTLLREVTPLAQATSGAFGAICVPYVEDLVIRDNAITDFGSRPGDPVCGIFILYGQIIDISRNQVLETRDWNLVTQKRGSVAGTRGGIVILAATPPTFTNPSSSNPIAQPAEAHPIKNVSPSYVPGVPALRVEHNVVRVASGDALEAGGFGPFSIVNNHLATAGTPLGEGVTAIAKTVFILNLGMSIDLASLAGKFKPFAQVFAHQMPLTSFLSRGSGNTSNGAVTFTDNMCQLEARVSQPHSFSSITIMTLDDLIFGNNQCWVDALRLTAALDAFLLAGSLQATSNRFQEAAGFPVLASGFTIGALNITGHNISTYCLFATGTSPLMPALKTKNLSLIPADICDRVVTGNNLYFTE